jgi:hypothetical protein
MEPILPEPAPLQPAPQALQPPVPSPDQSNGTGVQNATPANDSPQQLAPIQPIQQTPQVVQPIPLQPLPQQQQVAAPQQSDAPLIADDVDVIEKEWVDKAKNIVNQTKEDPYAQEQEVSRLQADYLAKRYNKNIKRAK